jgi:hypothetical protein
VVKRCHDRVLTGGTSGRGLRVKTRLLEKLPHSCHARHVWCRGWSGPSRHPPGVRPRWCQRPPLLAHLVQDAGDRDAWRGTSPPASALTPRFRRHIRQMLAGEECWRARRPAHAPAGVPTARGQTAGQHPTSSPLRGPPPPGRQPTSRRRAGPPALPLPTAPRRRWTGLVGGHGRWGRAHAPSVWAPPAPGQQVPPRRRLGRHPGQGFDPGRRLCDGGGRTRLKVGLDRRAVWVEEAAWPTWLKVLEWLDAPVA